ncbi:EF-hand domain-containing protein, partial [Vibrio alginolyticus]
YNNGSNEQQNLSWQFFRAMDVNGDGRVSLQEYTDFLRQTAGLAWVHPEMFRELDRNGDGQLDFWEVLTLYFVP